MKGVIAAASLGMCLVGAMVRADDAPRGVTLSGTIVCAKCTLRASDQRECHNVLLVHDGQRETRYWVVKNDVDRAFGDVCTGEKPVTVTGTTKDEHGKRWITPLTIDGASQTKTR